MQYVQDAAIRYHVLTWIQTEPSRALLSPKYSLRSYHLVDVTAHTKARRYPAACHPLAYA